MSIPLFEKVTIQLSNGEKLHFLTMETARYNKYISSLKLNKQPQSKVWFRLEVKLKGLAITADMSETPNLKLGHDAADLRRSRLTLDPHTPGAIPKLTARQHN